MLWTSCVKYVHCCAYCLLCPPEFERTVRAFCFICMFCRLGNTNERAVLCMRVKESHVRGWQGCWGFKKVLMGGCNVLCCKAQSMTTLKKWHNSEREKMVQHSFKLQTYGKTPLHYAIVLMVVYALPIPWLFSCCVSRAYTINFLDFFHGLWFKGCMQSM